LKQKLGKGLDEGYPFSDTVSVDVVLREAEQILSTHLCGHASRIWGFMSKFVMLDRFCKTLGVAKQYPGKTVVKKMCSNDYLGTGSKVNNSLENSRILLS
jgi:hypothetical protein